MKEYELDPILYGLPYCDRNLWEQTRLRIFSTASMFSKQKMTVTDIMTFPWEKELEEHTVEMSNEDRKRLAARANEIAKTLK